jgi:hypothetical protein
VGDGGDGGGLGGEGGDGGGFGGLGHQNGGGGGGGGEYTTRGPYASQSLQSVPREQHENCAPGPPSSQKPLFGFE